MVVLVVGAASIASSLQEGLPHRPADPSDPALGLGVFVQAWSHETTSPLPWFKRQAVRPVHVVNSTFPTRNLRKSSKVSQPPAVD